MLVFWEVAGRSAPLYASYPSAILRATYELTVVEGQLQLALWETLRGMAVGFGIAAILGVAIGYLMAAVRPIEIALQPYMRALYSTPRIALIPLLVLWAGIGTGLRVTVVVLSAIFPVIISTYDGSKSVGQQFNDVARSFVSGPFHRWRTVTVPGSLPFVFVGFRHGIARAISGILVAEMTGAVAGVGRLILQAGRVLRPDRLLPGVLLMGLLSIVLAVALLRLQRRLMPWSGQILAERDQR